MAPAINPIRKHLSHQMQGEISMEVYSVIEIEWLETGMWDFRLEKGVIVGAVFTGNYEQCCQYIDTWQY
jgi:hypothetical protein